MKKILVLVLFFLLLALPAQADRADVFGWDGTGSRAIRIDASTESLQTIPYEHHEIHSGSSFHADYSETTASSDDDVTGILLETPGTTKYAHMVITVSCSDPCEAILNEAPTLADSGDGTDLAVYNRNRNSAKTSTLQSLEDTATVGSVTSYDETEWGNIGISSGAELEHVFMAGGSGPKAVGGVSRGSQEWVLKASTIYAIYLQNTGANANTHFISIDWYEHTDKN